MGAFRIVYALSTMFGLAYCYESSFAFDLPTILNSFSNMATQTWSSSQGLTPVRASQDPDEDANSEEDSDAEGPTLLRIFQKVTFDVVGYMASMLTSLSRRTTKERRPRVEMGPGSYKTEQVTYLPNFFVNRLKMLLKFKKEEEEKKKPLNKPEK